MGIYSAPSLEPGDYEIRIEDEGFQTVVQNATVQAGGSVTVNAKLNLGATKEVVTVESSTAQLNYDTHTVAGVIARQNIQDLPINGRDFIALASLEPGVTTTPATTAQFNTTFNVSILGGTASRTYVTVDGASIQDQTDLGISMNFSQEVVQEFQLSQVNFDLSTGITGVGAINIVTRGGTNDFHGSAYFFYRDHNMAAYPGLARQQLDLHPFFARRNPGFWLGGPILKDKLFFFFNYEYQNQGQAVTVQPDLPSVSGLAGTFTSPYRSTTLSARFDYHINDRNMLFARYSDDRNTGYGPLSSVSPQPSDWVDNNNWADQSIVGLTSTLTSNLVNDARFSYGYWYNKNLQADPSQCVYPCVGGGLPPIYSMIGSSNFQLGGNYNAPQHRLTRRYEPQDNVTWQKGQHRLQFGGDLQHLTTPNYWGYCDPLCTDVYSIENLKASVPASALPLFNLPDKITSTADVLNLPVYNLAASGSAGIGIGGPWAPGNYNYVHELTQNKLHFYGQDIYKIRPNLTLNYGLGYIFETGLFNDDLPRPSFLSPIPYWGSDTGPGTGPKNNAFDFTPAFGFAWNIDKSGRTVIRGGGGMYWDTSPYYQKAKDMANTGPAGDGREVLSASILTNTFPGIVQFIHGQQVPLDIGAPLPLATITNMTLGQFLQIYNQQIAAVSSKIFSIPVPLSGPYSVSGLDIAKQGVQTFPEHFPLMRSYQTSLGVQRDMGHDMLLQVDWARRQFENVEMPEVDMNHYSEYINGARSPVIPICTTDQLYVPGQECSSGPITTLPPFGRTVYDGLLVKLTKRLSHRIQGTASYAMQKQVTIVSVQNLNNWFANYGENIPRHNLNVAGIGMLPWGFQLSVNSSIISRTPVMPTISGIDLSGTNQGSSSPIPGVAYNCFNAGCGKSDLAAAVASFNANYAGKKTANGTTIPSLILPSDYQFGDPTFSQDFRLTKTFTVKERYKFSIFGEMFNAFNIANLTGYSSALDKVNSNPAAQTYSFGKPTQRVVQTFGSGGPRAVQVGGRFTF